VGKAEEIWPQVVVPEIQQINFKKRFFADDNIINNRGYACELFKALIPWKLRRAGKLFSI
jgi:hypothetical protein